MTDANVSDVSAINARTAELSRKFVARTRDEVTQMRAGLARLDAGDRGGLTQIHQLAHRACGTGGTLGLLALSDAAGVLEQLIDACPTGTIPGASVRAQIEAAIDALEAQLK